MVGCFCPQISQIAQNVVGKNEYPVELIVEINYQHTLRNLRVCFPADYAEGADKGFCLELNFCGLEAVHFS